MNPTAVIHSSSVSILGRYVIVQRVDWTEDDEGNALKALQLSQVDVFECVAQAQEAVAEGERLFVMGTVVFLRNG